VVVKTYIATRYAMRAHVENVVRPMVERRGIIVSSRWHVPPYLDEDLTKHPLHVVREILEQNDRDIADSDAMLLLYEDGVRETLCELRLALVLEIPVVIVSHGETLPGSAYRLGVERVRSLSESLDVLAGWRKGHDARVYTAEGF
jgi:hypothetical protein